MSRVVVTVLVLSLALNLGFGLAWWGHHRSLDSFPGDHGAAWREGREHPRRMRDDGEGGWAPRRAHRLHRQLGLDAQRQEQLREALEPLDPVIDETRSELGEARRDFAEAMHVEAPDRDEVMVLRSEVSRLQAQLDSLVTEALLREAGILDLEERQRSGLPALLHTRGRPSREEMRR
jgi:Spy/CpxP family protein refolding chaperone